MGDPSRARHAGVGARRAFTADVTCRWRARDRPVERGRSRRRNFAHRASRTVWRVNGADLAPPARLRAMGTDVEVLALGADGATMRALAELAAEALERREAQWSRFRPTSELCRINEAAGAPVVVSRSTFSL